MKQYLLAFALVATSARAESALERLADSRLDPCSEEYQDGGDSKTFAKDLRAELKQRDRADHYLDPSIKPLLFAARDSSKVSASLKPAFQQYEISGLLSPETSRRILDGSERSYDIKLEGGKVLIWPALWQDNRRVRVTLEPIASLPESKVDPSLIAAMKKKSPSLSVLGGPKASADLNAVRNSKGVYEFLASGDGKLRDLGGLDAFLVDTLDGLCLKRELRQAWSRNRVGVGGSTKPVAPASAHGK
jgi:hypothetical protein